MKCAELSDFFHKLCFVQLTQVSTDLKSCHKQRIKFIWTYRCRNMLHVHWHYNAEIESVDVSYFVIAIILNRAGVRFNVGN